MSMRDTWNNASPENRPLTSREGGDVCSGTSSVPIDHGWAWMIVLGRLLMPSINEEVHFALHMSVCRSTTSLATPEYFAGR